MSEDGTEIVNKNYCVCSPLEDKDNGKKVKIFDSDAMVKGILPQQTVQEVQKIRDDHSSNIILKNHEKQYKNCLVWLLCRESCRLNSGHLFFYSYSFFCSCLNYSVLDDCSMSPRGIVLYVPLLSLFFRTNLFFAFMYCDS